ncbi:MAG: TY-Chap domain-containing protein [Ilumatobacteraceae bacterium]
MSDLDLNQHRDAQRRRQVCMTRLATYVREGRDYVVVLAHENRFDGSEPSDNPPYVQFAWREDLRLQIEVQGDHYRGQPYSDPQRRMLHRLGYRPPFELGEEFCNWTIFREAEGCQPDSVAQLLVDSLWQVFGVHFLDTTTCFRAAVSHWRLEWMVSSRKRDIKAETLRRFQPFSKM